MKNLKFSLSGSARNAATLTFDGVDVMGHRLVEEVESPFPCSVYFLIFYVGAMLLVQLWVACM